MWLTGAEAVVTLWSYSLLAKVQMVHGKTGVRPSMHMLAAIVPIKQ